jgi:EamA domain-containing membrane protein RarD
LGFSSIRSLFVASRAVGYALIWIALIVYPVDGLWQLRLRILPTGGAIVDR